MNVAWQHREEARRRLRAAISGLNAWIVVLVVEHEEYLGAVDLTSDVVTIPTGLASYFFV